MILNQLLDLRPESVQPRQGPLSSIDLFAGAGGLSIGLERAGFAIVSAVAWLPDACETFSTHHPKAAPPAQPPRFAT